MRVLILILLYILSLGCQDELTPPEIKIKQEVETDSKEGNINHQGINSQQTIESFISAFDSIYSIEKSEFFTVVPIDLKKEGRAHALALNQNGLSKASRYGVFTLLKYKSADESKNAFDELADLAKIISSKRTDSIFQLKTNEGFPLFYEVLSKSGSIFILKDQFIIHKLRRCNDDHILNEAKEEELLNYLYPKTFPDHSYFIRYCCSCPMSKGIVVR